MCQRIAFYEKYWYQIEEKDWPKVEQIFITKNGGGSDWAVWIREEGTFHLKRTTLGRFPKLDLAIAFTEAIRHDDPKDFLESK